MKHLLFFLLLLPIFLTAQKKDLQSHFLYEISGNELNGNSYLFGSIHLNDSRVFEFSDSLYYAISHSKQFASEIKMDSIDMKLNSIFLDFVSSKNDDNESDGINEDESNDNGSTKGNDTSEMFNSYDLNGEKTFLDLFLFQVAMNLNLASHGLENIDDQIDLMEDWVDNDEYNFGTSKYENLIDLYCQNDIEKLAESFDFDEDLEMISRNFIQAESFEKLAKQDKTFGVVGVGHLVGKDNVLDILKAKGYNVRRVEASKATKKLHEKFDESNNVDWVTIKNNDFKFEMLSNLNVEFQNMRDGFSMHFTTHFSQGLIFMTIAANANLFEDEQFVSLCKENILPLSHKFVESKTKYDSGTDIYNFNSNSDSTAFEAKIILNQNTKFLQLVIGISKKSLDSKLVDTYLSGLKINERKEKPFQLFSSEEFNYQYLFPADSEYIINDYKHPAAPLRPEAKIYYKVYEDNLNEGAYMIKHSFLPPGITYINAYESMEQLNEQLSTRFAAEVKSFEIYDFENNMYSNAMLVSETLGNIFIKNIIRGSLIYTAIQSSKTGTKDDKFFDEFKILPATLRSSNTYKFDDAKFSILSSEETYINKVNEETSFSSNLNDIGVVIDASFLKINKYEEYDLSDSIFTYENFGSEEMNEKVLKSEMYLYKDVCPGFIQEYQIDSTHMYGTRLDIYCNKHIGSISIISPLELRNSDIMNEIMESIKFDIDQESVSYFTKRKAPLIIEDLLSKDTSVFKSAKAAFNLYIDYNENDLQSIIKLLEKDFGDENEPYNFKYDIVTVLHDYNQDFISEAITDYYFKTNNISVKERIMESLSMRPSSKSIIRGLIKVSDDIKENQIVPEGLLANFADSLTLFESNYLVLKNIAKKNESVKKLLMELIISQFQGESIPLFVENDSMWIRQEVINGIAKYRADYESNSLETIDTYIMNYFYSTDDSENQNELYNFLENSEDTYGIYLMAIDGLNKDQSLSDMVIDKVMTDDYYAYWLFKEFDKYNRNIPLKYNNKSRIADVVMKNYYQDYYGVEIDNCKVLRPLTSDETSVGHMLISKCDGSEEGTYHLGIVGPFNELGNLDFDNEKSAFFETHQNEPDYEKLLPSLIEYINSQ